MDGTKPSQAKHLPDEGTDANGIGDSIVQDANGSVASKHLNNGTRSKRESDPEKDKDKEIPDSNRWSRFVNNVKKIAHVILFFVAVLGLLIAVGAYILSKREEDRALENHFDVEVRLITDHRGPRVQVSVTNKGETVAKKVSINADEYWKQFPPPKTKPEPFATNMQVQDDTPVDMVPDQTMFVEHKVDARRLRPLRNRQVTLHVDVELNWVDAEGQHFGDWFHFVQGGNFDPNAEVMGVDR